MESFEQYGGGKRDFEFRVGLAEGAWNSAEFGDRLWADVGDFLGVSFANSHAEPSGPDGYLYGFDDDAWLVSLFVDDGEPGWPLEKVPAMLTVWSRSDSLETWQVAERLYAHLAGLGRYLLIVFEEAGMPIASNFDIGDDW
ncbi:hypothetical protein [Streptomyces indicus]|uniref:Uncharacterized protein n=1 Tax=Streptomyces indicus TaxID=417292 RepID=A0A1G8WGU8_9ACTN|nr:hypothetical protein [Streptomyces indicus]SDJ77538.1 hypothetical protein SAMN05421806_102468 [Streptomyces indicus]